MVVNGLIKSSVTALTRELNDDDTPELIASEVAFLTHTTSALQCCVFSLLLW